MSIFWKSATTAPSRAVAGWLLALLVLLLPQAVRAAATPAEAALARADGILAAARAEPAPQECGTASDTLAQVLCRGVLRVGLRTEYPQFSERDQDGKFEGFEVDLARAIAQYLGVRLRIVPVDPRSRIPLLAGRTIDLTIATMGHTVQRDGNVRFIQPHYYESHTAVVGARSSPVTGWSDLQAGHVACLPIGASFNILFAQRHVKLLTFETPIQLLDALKFGQCAFVAHDDTFFARLLTDPEWSQHFAIKFTFAPLPWGMAVAIDGGARLEDLLEALSAAWHADGTFLKLARQAKIDVAFLSEQNALFAAPGCIGADGTVAPRCLVPPVDTSSADKPTPFAGAVAVVEAWLGALVGRPVDLSLIKSQATFDLLFEGVLYSLALVIGSMLATTAFAAGFNRLFASPLLPLRLLAGALTAIGQTTPMPLLLFFGYIVAGGLTYYSASVALVVAIVILGFYNGSYAGHAMHDAAVSLHLPQGQKPMFRTTVALAWTQMVAFLVNATKGSPAADMIGVPEFLNVVSDLTAHQRDRMLLYLVLLVFYSALVLTAIWGLSVIETRFVRRWRTLR